MTLKCLFFVVENLGIVCYLGDFIISEGSKNCL